MQNLFDNAKSFVKFGIVGVLNTLINWIIFIVLSASGIYYIISNVIAYTVATINSYLLNAKWVFNNGDNYTKETTIKFIILNLIGLVLNTVILYVLVDILNIRKVIAMIIATIIVMIINYFVNKLWVFKSK